MMRSALLAGVTAVICLLAGAPAAQTPPQQPIFRGGTNLVTVDAYPRRDGHVVEGLTPADFEVLEDGAAQAVNQFEFVRVEPVPEAARRDPNTQREMLQLAADPHNRVFVVYLDIPHVTEVGSHNIRGPLVDLLDRVIGPSDLFGVTTPKIAPASLVLGRKQISVDDQLTRFWAWGERNRLGRDPSDPRELTLVGCFAADRQGQPAMADDEGVSRKLTDIMIDRHREDETLTNLKELVGVVGAFREARTIMVLVTDGWRLFQPDQVLLNQGVQAVTGGSAPGPPPVGAPGGRLGTDADMTRGPSAPTCTAELSRLALLDDQQAFREIITLANRKNVVFYPVNPGGLELLDSTLATDAIPPTVDMAWHRNRVASVQSLAASTDGLAVTGTNDLRGGLTRIVNDVSAYYLLGYYSTNPKTDGKYRKITVRVKQPGVAVVARRGYVAASLTTNAAAAAAGGGASGAAAGVDVRDALGSLARIGSDVGLFTYGVASGPDLAVVAEIAGRQVELGKWRAGGTVRVDVAGAGGEKVDRVEAPLEPGARGVIVRVPVGAVPGPWRVGVTVIGDDGPLDDRLDVRPGTGTLLGDPIVYRGTAGPRGVLRPAAEFLFHRTERVHVEFPAIAALDRRSARLLDQRGQPLPIEVSLTERDDAGHTILVADLALAQLGAGDYVLDVSAGGGAQEGHRQVGLRVIR